MLSVAFAALRSRRAQTVGLGLLAGLVTAGAVGTPFYVYAATERVVVQHVAAASPATRSVALTAHTDVAADGLPSVDNTERILAQIFAPAGTAAFTGLRTSGTLRNATGATEEVPVAFRDGVCAHVTVRGACPVGDRDVMVSAALAGGLGIDVGDTIPALLTSDAPGAKPGTLRVVGIYTPIDTSDPYWGDHLLAATESAGFGEPDAVFTTRNGVLAGQADVTVERMVVVNGYIANPDALATAYNDINARGLDNFAADSDLPVLLDGIQTDTNSLLLTMPVLAGEVIALGWFALFIVLRALAADRRPDVGLMLLRGLPGRTRWSLFAAQNTIPIFAAAPFGAALGYLAARITAGGIRSADRERVAVLIAAGALLLVIVGALIAATFADRRRGTPILEMLRTTPARRRGWRSDAVDIAVVAIAVLGVVQSHLAPAAARPAFLLLVPALVALAAGLVAARFVAPVAAGLIGRGLRAGDALTVLTAAYVARRPGLERIFALLVVTTTLAATAVLSWHLASGAQNARARVDLGADRVLSTAGMSPIAVLAATRAADPSGRYLMAVTSYTTDATDKVLAVDSPRLGAVLAGGADPGGLAATRLAALLRPAPPTSVAITSGTLTMTVTVQTLPAAPTFAIVDLVTPTGAALRAIFGPLDARTTTYRAPVGGCDAGCRFAGVELGHASGPGVSVDSIRSGQAALIGRATGASVTFSALAETAALPIDFTDRSRWRTTLDGKAVGPVLAIGPGGLLMAIPTGEQLVGRDFDSRAYLIDSPIPLPAVMATGSQLTGTVGAPVIRPFGGGAVPVRVVASQPTLPLVGSAGAIVDLEYALHAADPSNAVARPAVWLRADTPTPVIARMRSLGVITSGEDSLGAAEARYRAQVPETIRRLSLALAAIGTALSMIAVLIAAGVERRPRSRELAALRAQGVDTTTVRRTAVAGYLLHCGVAVAIGLVGAVTVQAVRTGGFVVFSDNWAVLPAPGVYPPGGWLLTIVVCAIPVSATALVAARQLARAVTRRGQESAR